MDKPYTMTSLTSNGDLIIEYVEILKSSKNSRVYRYVINNDDKFVKTYFCDINELNELLISMEGVEYKVPKPNIKKICECYIEKYKKSFILDLVDMRHFCYLKNEDFNNIKYSFEEKINKLQKRKSKLERINAKLINHIEQLNNTEQINNNKIIELQNKYDKKRKKYDELKNVNANLHFQQNEKFEKNKCENKNENRKKKNLLEHNNKIYKRVKKI